MSIVIWLIVWTMMCQATMVVLVRRFWTGRLVDWSVSHGDWGMVALGWFVIVGGSVLGVLGYWCGHLIGVG